MKALNFELCAPPRSMDTSASSQLGGGELCICTRGWICLNEHAENALNMRQRGCLHVQRQSCSRKGGVRSQVHLFGSILRFACS